MATVTATSDGKYLCVHVADVVLADSDGAKVISALSPVLVDAAGHHIDLSDAKIGFVAQVNDTQGADANWEPVVYISPDKGATWVQAYAPTGVDLDTSGLNTATKLLDLSGIHAPRWKIGMVSDGTDTVSSGLINYDIAVPVK